MGFTLVTRVGVGTRDGKTLAVLTQGFLRGVVACNRIAIRSAKRRGRPLPRLYESGVEYEREPWPKGLEEFADINTILKRGWGDCDDLCAARVAELQEDGEHADCRVYWRRRCECGEWDSGAGKCARCGQSLEGRPIKMHCEVRRGVCFACSSKLNVVNGRHVCPGCRRHDSGKIEDPSRFLGL
jgi:hypothetical protein